MTTETLLRAVAIYTRVSQRTMMEMDRQAEHVMARWLVYYFHRRYTLMSLAEIGALFMQDHATALHAINKINNFLSINDKTYTDAIKTIDTVINAGRNNDTTARQNLSRVTKQLPVRPLGGNAARQGITSTYQRTAPVLPYFRQARVV